MHTHTSGVQGIIVPKVNTRAQAEVVAAACKFRTPAWPQGRRGMFVSRQGYGVEGNYFMQVQYGEVVPEYIYTLVGGRDWTIEKEKKSNVATLLLHAHVHVYFVCIVLYM